MENGTGKDWKEFEFKKDYAKMMRKYRNLEWEVKALRAYYYFELVKRYNRIPLITKVLTEEEANNQVPVDYQTIVDFIVRECDEVTEDGRLPAVYN
ncbi:UNVERIFIED_CONTAM: RagB/SusD family nutrient uptake outer membrane protein, partial [Prevotella sp. 15_C9]